VLTAALFLRAKNGEITHMSNSWKMDKQNIYSIERHSAIKKNEILTQDATG
jgi:hypothetical protein